MAFDLATVIAEWVEQELSLPFTIAIDLIQNPDEDGGCIRYDPSSASERRFIDGSRLIPRNLSIYIRCKNASTARTLACAIGECLDGITIHHQQTSIECESVTTAQFLECDQKGFTIYLVGIAASYLDCGFPPEDENKYKGVFPWQI